MDRNRDDVSDQRLYRVALRKESVDRNLRIMPLVDLQTPSLSARRAWIEIVDVVSVQHGCEGRSPQGERG